MQQALEGQINNGNFSVIPRSQVPEGARVLSAVWAMRRKRRISTQEVYKWKARLNIDGSKQVEGEDFWETYNPVANWASIRLLLTMALVNKLPTRQIDFFQTYTQGTVEKDMYMAIPRGCEASTPGDFVLKIHKNIQGQKQASRVSN